MNQINLPKEEKPNSPWLIFQYAESFHNAVTRIRPNPAANKKPQSVEDMVRGVPMAVADAFASELYLKCLQAMELGKPAKGHDLKRLFDKLPSGTRNAIKAQYTNGVKANQDVVRSIRSAHPGFDVGFDNVIVMSSGVFERVRYLYEGTHPNMFYWPVLSESLRKTILAINPAWKE
jgi:hypothetical protein